ncbi:MAG TPA: pseudouridine synthase [Candidatus Dormibacteraeota bacterium]|jgi:23S rRNA pseudouridine2605 synthase|nr:pseudouridine synthase [Candidatus Dormibacteraeota bacterium]
MPDAPAASANPDAPGGGQVRLNRYLAMSGVAARRKADHLIATGRVRVNGVPPPPGGQMITPGVDRVEVDGRLVAPEGVRRYVAVNKPPGHLTAVSDRTHRPLVTALLPPEVARGLTPVGRLDLESRGLLILTDDGELSFRLQHPRHHVEKEYQVRLHRPMAPEAVERLRAGVELDEGRATPAALLPDGPQGTEYRIVLRQGWKRQIRRMFLAVGVRVVDLRRVRVGSLQLGELKEGGWRELTPAEVVDLRAEVGLPPDGAGAPEPR